MSFRDYTNEMMCLPKFITGEGPISNHGKYIDEMIEKLKMYKINPASPGISEEKKRVKLAKKAMADLEKMRKQLNTIHYGKNR